MITQSSVKKNGPTSQSIGASGEVHAMDDWGNLWLQRGSTAPILKHPISVARFDSLNSEGPNSLVLIPGMLPIRIESIDSGGPVRMSPNTRVPGKRSTPSRLMDIA